MTLRRIARTFALGATVVWLAAACSPRGGEGMGKGPEAERAGAKGAAPRGAGDTAAGPGYVYRLASSACLNPMISPDTVSLRCTGTPVGDVTIDGRFLVRATTFWDSPYNDDATPVLRALVVVSRDGRETHHAVHTFTFTSGD